MHFYIGGAYQGKLDLAKRKFDLTENDIFTCTEEVCSIDFDKRCIDHVEEFVLCCVRNHMDATEYFQTNSEKWKNSIIICADIFCGVVPLGADLRAWRDMTGRLSAFLSNEAESVTRVFCGLEQCLK